MRRALNSQPVLGRPSGNLAGSDLAQPIRSLKFIHRNDSPVARRVLHQPVPRLTLEPIAIGRASDLKGLSELFGQYRHSSGTVGASVAWRQRRYRFIAREKSVAGHAPSITGRSGHQGIAADVVIGAFATSHGARSGREHHLYGFAFDVHGRGRISAQFHPLKQHVDPIFGAPRRSIRAAPRCAAQRHSRGTPIRCSQ